MPPLETRCRHQSVYHTDFGEIWKNGRLTICQHIEALLALLEILNRLLDGRKISQVDMQKL